MFEGRVVEGPVTARQMVSPIPDGVTSKRTDGTPTIR